jgi:hypothetical protein
MFNSDGCVWRGMLIWDVGEGFVAGGGDCEDYYREL